MSKGFSQEVYIHHRFLGHCYHDESPKESLKFFHKLLNYIKEYREDIYRDRHLKKDFMEKLNGMFFNDIGIKQIILVMLEENEILNSFEAAEEGIEVPGFLTKKGNDFLDMLNKLYDDKTVKRVCND